MNVMKLEGGWRFYLRHPLKFFRDLGLCVRDVVHRAKYGWAYVDVWNMCDWFLDVMPAMLKHLADNHCACPCDDERFPNPEDWTEWLREQADKLVLCREDGITNEFEKDFQRLADAKRNSTNGVSVTYEDSAEFEEVKKKFFNRQKEIYNERCKLIKEVFDELAANFFNLWD